MGINYCSGKKEQLDYREKVNGGKIDCKEIPITIEAANSKILGVRQKGDEF